MTHRDKLAGIQSLHERPGFMIRRAHQIAQSLFLEESAPFNVTPSQYGALRILHAAPGLDQNSLSNLLGLDRSTTALVIGKLTAAGLVERVSDTTDRRRHKLTLTDQGRKKLDELAAPLQRSHERLLTAFSPAEAVEFLRLLKKFIAAFNHVARAPLVPPPER